jgi:lipopolysaccharide export system protein LptA
VDAFNATGTNEQAGRHVDYGAKKMVALFNDDGDMTQITAEPESRLLSTVAASKTSVTANKAVLQFNVEPEMVNGEERHNSILHHAFATGNAVVDSSPVPVPNVKPADTRILRSDSIEIEMKPGGREIQALRTNAPGQLEFKPNQSDRPHRWMDGDRIQIAYGDANAVDSFHATKATTRTEKPLPADKRTGKDGKPAPPPPPALTSSDELTAKFAPRGNELSTLEQTGNFHYEEGLRHASSDKAFLEQASNKITLTGSARVWDNTGSTLGDTILLDQQSGDMDATGNVASTRQPDQQKNRQESSLLDQSQPLQARADKMQTRDNNVKIRYEGNAVLWQAANRLQADLVLIDRGEQTLHATGHVISQLVDSQNNGTPPAQTTETNGVRLEQVVEKTPAAKKKAGPPIFTVIRAPELFYRDDERLAHYTGGVKLVRDKMTVTSDELQAFLTKDNANKDADSGTSLDHAFADGDVKVVQMSAGRTRTGTSDHLEYYPKEDKVILNGGLAKMADTRKGTTIGQQLTYFSNTDHVIVEGMPKKPVVTDMNRQR